MATFLFWNLMGNDKESWSSRAVGLAENVAQIAETCAVDVFLFAESGFRPNELIDALNKRNVGAFSQPASQFRKIQILTRLDPGMIAEQYDSFDGRLTIRRLFFARMDILLGIVHYRGRPHWTADDQALHATEVRQEIEKSEDLVGHQRTVLVGDFNMNPFDTGMAASHCLNAVMTKVIAGRGTRVVASKEYAFFYNPMWGHFGDRTPGSAGTYYYSGSAPINYYWNIYDQVLLRPGLMDSLADLRILDSDGERPLVTEHGLPHARAASDHLPILFRLEL